MTDRDRFIRALDPGAYVTPPGGVPTLGFDASESDDALRAEGAAVERARIVAWLREPHPDDNAGHGVACRAIASALEAGAHDDRGGRNV